MLIEKYSFGMGDRFGNEGEAQMAAIMEINRLGIPVVPVWNKSFREHSIIHTTHESVALEAAAAVKAHNWKGNFYVDADHIGMATVDQFLNFSNFFTIDVAHFIGQKVDSAAKESFVSKYSSYIGKLVIPGISEQYNVTKEFLGEIADKYLSAINEVKRIYDYISSKKGANNFVPEVSMDECELAQTPIELFFILAELKSQNVEIQTIAPKFSGLFAKGVDYIGDIAKFTLEFEQDVAVLQFAVKELGLPKNLKLSVHSGSDKFSIYPAIKNAIRKFDSGIHVKTAGTTWLEEVIGLADGGGEGLKIAKEIYAQSLLRYDELVGPYSTVLDINKANLPKATDVNLWNSQQFSEALTHNKKCQAYNPHFRQLIHVGYKIAVELGDSYYSALKTYRKPIEKNVTYNILDRHLKLLFLD